MYEENTNNFEEETGCCLASVACCCEDCENTNNVNDSELDILLKELGDREGPDNMLIQPEDERVYLEVSFAVNKKFEEVFRMMNELQYRYGVYDSCKIILPAVDLETALINKKLLKKKFKSNFLDKNWKRKYKEVIKRIPDELLEKKALLKSYYNEYENNDYTPLVEEDKDQKAFTWHIIEDEYYMRETLFTVTERGTKVIAKFKFDAADIHGICKETLEKRIGMIVGTFADMDMSTKGMLQLAWVDPEECCYDLKKTQLTINYMEIPELGDLVFEVTGLASKLNTKETYSIPEQIRVNCQDMTVREHLNVSVKFSEESARVFKAAHLVNQKLKEVGFMSDRVEFEEIINKLTTDFNPIHVYGEEMKVLSNFDYEDMDYEIENILNKVIAECETEDEKQLIKEAYCRYMREGIAKYELLETIRHFMNNIIEIEQSEITETNWNLKCTLIGLYTDDIEMMFNFMEHVGNKLEKYELGCAVK